MKILFVHDNHVHVGGAETYMFALMDLLRKSGHETYLFSTDKEIGKKETYLFVYKETKKNRVTNHLSQYYFDAGVYKALRGWIKEVRPDVIHLQNIVKYTSSILIAAGSSGVPVVQTVHDIRLVCPGGLCIRPDGGVCEGGFGRKCTRNGCIRYKSYFYNILPNLLKRSLIRRRVKLILSPSRALEEKLQENGIRNVVFVPHFIDAEEYDSDPSRIESSYILSVGMLEKHKGLRYVIEAFPEIVKRFGGARLHLVGEGPEKDVLQKLSTDLGIGEYVTFHGKVASDQLSEYYSKAAVIVFPSVCFENSPYVVREAMASGRPVVGTDVGGIPELIDEGDTGFLVGIRNPQQIADRVIRILSDAGLAAEMGTNARAKAEREFKRKDHLDKILNVYQSVSK